MIKKGVVMAAKLTVLEKDISTFKQGDIEYINITILLDIKTQLVLMT